MYVQPCDTKDRGRTATGGEQNTVLKQAEVASSHQQVMPSQREKLADMSSLLAGMVHELNSPLAVIMIQSELLLDEVADTPLVERAMHINDAAERCICIVRNALRLARQSSPERTQVHLNLVIAEALQACTYGLQQDSIEVSQHLADGLPSLWANAQQLYQVVVNLLLNAQYALREAPAFRRLTLMTRFDPLRHQIVLSVADTGPGIPPEIQTRLFEPFFTTKPAGIGTGIGLSLCHDILVDHGGSCSVESRLGAGATFRVTLPVAVAPGRSPDVMESAVLPPITGKELLVIDDGAAVLKAIVAVLRRDGHVVDTASSGLQALVKLRQRSYDLIVCDLHMAELDGAEFYRVLAQDYPRFLSRFLLLTGDALGPAAQKFLEASGVPYLSKPCRSVELRQMVQHMLQKLSDADCFPIHHAAEPDVL